MFSNVIQSLRRPCSGPSYTGPRQKTTLFSFFYFVGIFDFPVRRESWPAKTGEKSTNKREESLRGFRSIALRGSSGHSQRTAAASEKKINNTFCDFISLVHKSLKLTCWQKKICRRSRNHRVNWVKQRSLINLLPGKFRPHFSCLLSLSGHDDRIWRVRRPPGIGQSRPRYGMEVSNLVTSH